VLDRWTHNRWVRNRYTRPIARWVRRVYALLFGPDPGPGVPLPAAAPPSVNGIPPMPAWLQEELHLLSSLEPELLPPGTDINRYCFYAVPMDTRAGEVYSQLSRQIGDESFTHVLLIPWLKPGGADRGILYHARAIAESDPNSRILVLSTEHAASPWAQQLPQAARFVAFGSMAAGLEFGQQVAVMVRVLVQLRAPVVHLINSRVGWEAVLRHGLALTQHSRLYASLFCDDYDARMNPVGYARDYLRYCYPYLSAVICDNSRYPKIWSLELGVPSSSFMALPFPYDGEMPPASADPITGPDAGSVLWAGRLDRQKRPDILAAVAARMPETQFDVYGASVMSGAASQDLGALRRLRNVTLHGEFHRLEAVATSSHFAYLHTTAWEGTPTILFDVAAARLPICAPAVGGIVDFLPEEDLVANPEDVDAFVARLQELRDSAELREASVRQQVMALRNSRQWQSFIGRLAELDGYLSPIRANSVDKAVSQAQTMESN